jgi:hypothetical protein
MTPKPHAFRALAALLLTAVIPLGVVSSPEEDEGTIPTDPPPIIVKSGVHAAR